MMSTICLIRHGQASAHKADYDQSRPCGEQSRSKALETHILNPTTVWVAHVNGTVKPLKPCFEKAGLSQFGMRHFGRVLSG